MPPPTRRFAFLFTDIEGSTRLWETAPDRMSAALTRHDAACREVVGAHAGRVVKTMGDGIFAAFAGTRDAVAAAIALQQAVAAIARDSDLPLAIRCGVHAGDAQPRDGEFFGPVVNTTARVMSAAHGGQVLVTSDVAEELGADRPPGVDFLALGRARLRDVATPIHLLQAIHADLRRTFPPLRSLDAIPHNLPRETTTFVGRGHEIAQVTERLAGAHLVTLTGAGGCGKSRLALRVAAAALESFADGAWLVELAALADASLVAQSIASALGVTAQRDEAVLDAVVRHLASREALVMLDNAEHLLAACASAADAILRRCPRVKVLASSREPLGIDGEVVYRVPSLSIPDAREALAPDELGRYEAVALFVARAQDHQPQFALGARNATAVASVCRRLDGIPLAIELAAARLRAMTVEDIDRRLDQRFRLLTGGARTALPRQQTLRSLIDWSYDLLAVPERILLARMSVFADGWTMEAAEAVGAGDGIAAEDVLDMLASLTDKSLVVAGERDRASRYRLLETVRQYARDRLLEAGDGIQVRDRHFAFFHALAKEAEPGLRSADMATWLDRLAAEHDNLRAALDWSLGDGGDAGAGLDIAKCIVWFWLMRGFHEEGLDYLRRLLAATADADPQIRARVMTGAGILAHQRGDRAAARELHTEALAIFRKAGAKFGMAMAYNNLGNISDDEGDFNASKAVYEQALALVREVGDERSMAAVLGNLANIPYESGDFATARTYYEEALALQRRHNDTPSVASSLINLATMALVAGAIGEARARIVEVAAVTSALASPRIGANALHAAALVEAALGRAARSATAWGCEQRMREESGIARAPKETGQRLRSLADLRATLGEEAFEAAWRAGRVMDFAAAMLFLGEVGDDA